MVKYKGIDTSLWQGSVDWKKVRADGVEFAMIKASQGRTKTYDQPFTDPRFHESAKGAGAAGLYWGAYHYLCARNAIEARQEAEYFVNLLLPYKHQMKLWAAVDVEDSTIAALSQKELTDIVDTFCKIVKAAGLRPMVYTNTNWLEWAKEFIPPKDVPIWQAHYGRADHPNGAKIWQYTDKGDVDGIYGNVDMNEGIDIIGDANGDGKVNLTDAAVMMKHIAKHKGTKIDEGQADINDDGYVTLSDVSALMKRIAGWK
jgi:GH25 family lysozyme M1 (1,4-beta-N-acetylmuramidase)